MSLPITLPRLILSLFFLLNENPPFGEFYSYLRENISLFKEGFRTPYTKFSILFMFVTSYYFAYFLNAIKKYFGYLYYLICLLIIFGLVVYILPAFSGNLISPSMKILIPNEYFEMFEWFNDHPSGRVAKFPMHTKWNWNYYDWGYQGSGITWFGMENPQFDRDFDRWSKYNENFYNEINSTVYTQDQTLFENILDKYDVQYLLLDESVINAGGGNEMLYINEFKNMVLNLNNITEEIKFGFITVYKINNQKQEIYSPDINYSESRSFNFNELDSSKSITENFNVNHGYETAQNCELNKEGEVSRIYLNSGVKYSAENNAASCDYFPYPNLEYSQGYVFRIKGINNAGRGLKIYLFNNKLNYLELEELLPQGEFDEYFIIYPKDITGAGYTLNIETRAFGRISSENEINLIEFTPIPIKQLQEIRMGNNNVINNKLKIISSKKYNPVLYATKVVSTNYHNNLIALSQGYESGWIAISDYKLLKHVKLNSWANGWLVPEGEHEIIIFFWPQLLEWFGFLLIPISILLLFRFKK